MQAAGETERYVWWILCTALLRPPGHAFLALPNINYKRGDTFSFTDYTPFRTVYTAKGGATAATGIYQSHKLVRPKPIIVGDSNSPFRWRRLEL